MSRRTYAALVLSYVVPPASPTPAAVGMADSRAHVHQRIEAMVTSHPPRLVRPLAWLVAPAVLLLGALALTAAQGLVAAPVVPPAEPTPAPLAPADTTVYMVVDEMPELVGGLEGLRDRLVYPDLARRAGIEGTVFIHFIVDERGEVVSPEVVRGIGGGADEAALEAVEASRFTPGRLRGEPVRVRMVIPVRFQLSGESRPPPPASGAATAPRGFHARMAGLPQPVGRDGRAEAVTFSGVVYYDDAPVAGARVYSEGDPANAVTTGPDGAFTLRQAIPIQAREDGGTGGRFVITHPVHGTATTVWGGSEHPPAPRVQPDEQAPEFAVRGVYPNPTTGEVRVEITLPAAAEATVTLYDAAGRRVRDGAPRELSAGVQTLTLDGVGLAAGAYTYRVAAQAAERAYTASGTFTVVR